MTANPIRLLLLEDSDTDAMLEQETLAEYAPSEFVTTRVGRLAEALERIRTERFDVMLSDLGLPDSFGLHTVEALVSGAPAMPLVVLTGARDNELGREAILHGAQDFLVKGESSGALVARTLRHAIERKRLEIGLREANEMLEDRVTERTATLEQALESVQESEERYRAVSQSANDAIVTVDAAGNVVGWNRGAENIFGYTEIEISGNSLLLLIPERYHERYETGLQRAVSGGDHDFTGKTVEMEGLRKGSSEFPLELSLSMWEVAGKRFFTGVIRDVTERKRTQGIAEREHIRLQTILKTASDGIHIIDADGVLVEANQAFLGMLGYDDSAIGRLRVTDWDVQEKWPAIKARIDELIAMLGRTVFETRHRRRDGVVLDVEISLSAVVLDGKSYLYSASRDITARKAAATKIHRLSNLYAALSQCNQAIVRCADEQQLFAQICSDAVQFGGMNMAWIGTLDEAGKHIKPVAAFGNGTQYLEGLAISVDADDPNGRGPTGSAFRENTSFWCQDFQNDPITAPWRDRASMYGWAASAALPLLRNGWVVGVLTLYASETNAFDQAARNLLEEMALVISFALDNFVREKARRQAEAALRESEARYRAMQFERSADNEQSSGAAIRDRASLPDVAESLRASPGMNDAQRAVQERLASANAHLAKLSMQLVEVQELERKNLAREMHDELGQRLTLLKISVHRMREFISEPRALNTWEKIDEEVTALVAQIRAMSGSLRPQTLDYVGLEAAVRQLLENQFASTNIGCEFEYVGLPDKIAAPFDITAYRMVQEGVTNIVRHANASQVVVEINGGESGDEMEIVVRDNGSGFDLARVKNLQSGSISSGLLGLRERIGLLGGSVDVETSIGKGTRLVASLPLKGAANAKN
jgi:PAS domain S-box-containing protein